jgi:hypothetical protein
MVVVIRYLIWSVLCFVFSCWFPWLYTGCHEHLSVTREQAIVVACRSRARTLLQLCCTFRRGQEAPNLRAPAVD